jgi:hypothetical protein
VVGDYALMPFLGVAIFPSFSFFSARYFLESKNLLMLYHKQKNKPMIA